MKKTFALVLATLVLLLTCMAPAVAEDELFEFYGIPFGETPRETALEILSQYGDFEIDQNGYILNVPFAGHEFTVNIQNAGKHLGCIDLHPNGASYGAPKGEEYDRAVDENIQLFIKLDQGLTQVYGEPDIRCFYTFDKKESHIYMFASGEWEYDEMIEMYRKEGKFWANSIWNNVFLRNWTRGEEIEYPNGCPCEVFVRYNDYSLIRNGIEPVPVYPPVEEE